MLPYGQMIILNFIALRMMESYGGHHPTVLSSRFSGTCPLSSFLPPVGYLSEALNKICLKPPVELGSWTVQSMELVCVPDFHSANWSGTFGYWASSARSISWPSAWLVVEIAITQSYKRLWVADMRSFGPVMGFVSTTYAVAHLIHGCSQCQVYQRLISCSHRKLGNGQKLLQRERSIFMQSTKLSKFGMDSTFMVLPSWRLHAFVRSCTENDPDLDILLTNSKLAMDITRSSNSCFNPDLCLAQ